MAGRRILLVLLAAGCGQTELALDAAFPDGGAEAAAAPDAGAASDVAAPDAAAPDATPDAERPPDLAADLAPDAEPPWIAPPSCAGLKLNGPPLAVFDATGLTKPYMPGRPTCEGDNPYPVQVNRVLCGSIPAGNLTVVANSIGPLITEPLMPGERALLAVYGSACSIYNPPLYGVSERRDVGAWATLAAMLRPDGGP